MGAAGLMEIKRRIKSVENTMKLTKAMNLVATSKLRKSRSELNLLKEYDESLQEIITIMNSYIINENVDNVFFNPVKSDVKLFVIITSEIGLCSGYNINVIEYFRQNYLDDNIKILVIGQKGINYLRKFNIKADVEYINISDVPTDQEIKYICSEIIKMYKTEVSEISVVYTDFVSTIKQVVKSEVVLPIKTETVTGEVAISSNVNELIDKCGELYLNNTLYKMILSSKASEFSYRMISMDKATENASDIITDLNTKYNRIRQTIITQEISEIVGGAEAQK